jgi:hypothetical protein
MKDVNWKEIGTGLALIVVGSIIALFAYDQIKSKWLMPKSTATIPSTTSTTTATSV